MRRAYSATSPNVPKRCAKCSENPKPSDGLTPAGRFFSEIGPAFFVKLWTNTGKCAKINNIVNIVKTKRSESGPMRAENAGSAPERAGCGGLRGTVSASAAVSDACGALRLTEKRVPMKLLFKQRFFSWFDSYDIYNEAGDTVYVVKGQLSWGHCLKIFDSLGNELGTVRERVLTFLPQFELYLGDTSAASARRLPSSGPSTISTATAGMWRAIFSGGITKSATPPDRRSPWCPRSFSTRRTPTQSMYTTRRTRFTR